MRLDHIAASILYLLWRRRRSNDGSLVSAKTLHEQLLEGQAHTKFRDNLQATAVKKTLRKLKLAGMVEFGVSQKCDPVPGPAPAGYRLSADAPIITWRATAAIVMLLHNHPERRPKREGFIRETLKQGLTHHNREDRLNSREVSELIDWCLRREYFKEEKIIIDEMSAPQEEHRLITTSKVDDHELFLKKLAAEVRIETRGEFGDELRGREIDIAG